MSKYDGIVIVSDFSGDKDIPSETSDLLPQSRLQVQGVSEVSTRQKTKRWVGILVFSSVLVVTICSMVTAIISIRRSKPGSKTRRFDEESRIRGFDDEDVPDKLDESVSILGKSEVSYQPPTAMRRCEWVENMFRARDARETEDDLRMRYEAQSADANVFYRATAGIFWSDLSGDWDNLSLKSLGIEPKDATLQDGVLLQEKNTWTWVTGDQHLSNFGAWRNRHREVVFSVNDFDEAAIYDFHIDVARVAVSICNHAVTNGLNKDETDDALKKFAYSYVDTVIGYVGNEDALLYELTQKNAEGKLEKFLKKIEDKKSSEKQMVKFTDVDPLTGTRYFIKGSNETRLEAVSPEMERKIREAFTSDRYGATMMKTGWKVHEWDDDYFEVLDIAARIGSGIGSFGVDRYYVLLKGEDGLLDEDGQDGHAVILDVKFEPRPALSNALSPDDAAWYNNLFQNEAARVVQGQRRLTSYVDPFTGWILLDDEESGIARPFYVRQRSPWKASFDLDILTDPDDFNEFVTQIGIVTATSHTRGTAAKAPGEFKHVVKAILGEKDNRKAWRKALTLFAHAYREQVLLDFECFKEFVKGKFSAPQ